MKEINFFKFFFPSRKARFILTIYPPFIVKFSSSSARIHRAYSRSSATFFNLIFNFTRKTVKIKMFFVYFKSNFLNVISIILYLIYIQLIEFIVEQKCPHCNIFYNIAKDN